MDRARIVDEIRMTHDQLLKARNVVTSLKALVAVTVAALNCHEAEQTAAERKLGALEQKLMALEALVEPDPEADRAAK